MLHYHKFSANGFEQAVLLRKKSFDSRLNLYNFVEERPVSKLPTIKLSKSTILALKNAQEEVLSTEEIDSAIGDIMKFAI